MKLRFLALSLILFTGLSAAQSSNNTSIDASPGLVKADSPIYGLDVAFDNTLQAVGLKSAGGIAVERASEVAVAQKRNHSKAVDKALNQFNRSVGKADNRDREKLQRAQDILKQVKQKVPQEAQQGINTALKNVERAKNRIPDNLTSDNGGPLPDIKLPGGNGSGDLDVPGDGGSGGKAPR